MAEGQDAERKQRDMIRELSAPGIFDSTGRFIDLPLKEGVLTYHINGWAPTGKVSPSTGRQILKKTFVQWVSVTPAYDVERALRFGSTSVVVATNYEPSEDEIREQEEDERGAVEDEKKFQELRKRTFHRGESIRVYCDYEKKEVELKDAKRFKKSKPDEPVIEGTCASCGKQVHMIGRLE